MSYVSFLAKFNSIILFVILSISYITKFPDLKFLLYKIFLNILAMLPFFIRKINIQTKQKIAINLYI